MSGRPLLYLTTVGAKSGQPRTAVVMPFPEGDDAWLIVASANGAAGHPAWLNNLAAHPDQVEIEFEDCKTTVTPPTLIGDKKWAPAYDSRTVPVVAREAALSSAAGSTPRSRPEPRL